MPCENQDTFVIHVFLQDPAGSASYHYMDLWSSDWTWDGQGHPVDGDDVIIDSNMTVILDTDTPMMRLLHIRGE